MWRWRRMEKISWIDRVRKEEVLHRVKEEEMNILQIKRRKSNWLVTSCVGTAL
jgi:hypothetical protein